MIDDLFGAMSAGSQMNIVTELRRTNDLLERIALSLEAFEKAIIFKEGGKE